MREKMTELLKWPRYCFYLFLCAIVAASCFPASHAHAGVASTGGWQQTSPAASPPARYFSTLVYDAARQNAVLFGGYNGSKLGDTWIFDESTTEWTQLHPTTSPASRYGIMNMIVYDSGHSEALLFGGYEGSVGYNDTWVWNGNDWTQKNPGNSPSKRWESHMAYDSSREKTYLFGGYNAICSCNLNDTWEWDGTDWTQLSPATSPPATNAGAMAYDAANNETVLFDKNGETWTFDGTAWTRKFPAVSPPQRSFAVMVYDEEIGKLLLLGGTQSGMSHNDVWAWDGATWTQITAAAAPAERFGLFAAYVPLLKGIMVFGGADNSSTFGDTWFWDTAVSGVIFSPSTAVGGSAAEWIVRFTISDQGELLAGTDTITITGPADMVFSAEADDYSVNGATVAATPSQLASNRITFAVPDTIAASSPVIVHITGATNPATLTADQFTVSTSFDSIGVSPDGFAPYAVADSYSTNEDAELTVNAASGVLDNDTDAEDDTLTAVKVTDPGHGTLTFNADGSFTYTPDADYAGADSFTYKANDGAADSATATVSLTVNAVNDAPVIGTNAGLTVNEGDSGTIGPAELETTDVDNAAADLTYMIKSLPAHGALKKSGTTLNVNDTFTQADVNGNSITYEHDGGETTSDSFAFDVSDGSADVTGQTFALTIAAANDAPIAVADSYNMLENTALTVNAAAGVLDNDTDAEDDALTAVKITDPGHGTLTLNADGSFTYAPDADYTGTDSFTYKANDGSADSAEATVSIAVANVPGSNADLSDLTLSGGTLSPAFASGTINYIASVANNVYAITVSASVYDSNATIKVNGTTVASGQASDAINLNIGGNGVWVQVTAEDGTTTKTYNITVIRAANSAVPALTPAVDDGDDAGEGSNTSVDIWINGKAENIGKAMISKKDNLTLTTVTMDGKKLEDKLAAEGQGAVVTIPVNAASDAIIAELNGQMVKNMEHKQAVVEIKTAQATFTLPAWQINIDAISGQIGTAVPLQDIHVRIEIAKPTADLLQAAENAAANGKFTIVAPPLNFTITGTYGNKTVEVSRFNVYVERAIAIPEGVAPNGITTGVAIDSDGTVRHVPTKVVNIDGKFYARINSLTNSAYTVVWHPLEFGDAANHWAKEAVNDMGSRMVIDSSDSGLFSPDRAITRAEFAVIVVRGLGLGPEDGASRFRDVRETDGYSGAINTAYAYGLISGFADGTFRPNDGITREQAMVVIHRAMTITNLQAKLAAGADATLRPFADAADISSWARSSVAENVQSGIVAGRSGSKLAPKAYMTRAEAAALVHRLLQKSDLI